MIHFDQCDARAMNKSTSRKRKSSKNIKKQKHASNTISRSVPIQCDQNADKNLLSSWRLPEKLLSHYLNKGISRLFDWQVECLELPGVLEQKSNLVYSAPTSAGKSMVSDILIFKTVLEKRKKTIIVLPFVSITVEKVHSLKSVCRKIGCRIESFAGNVNPPGGFLKVDVAVCTIEKANNIINKMIEESKLNEIGLIVVDELHMIADSSRGYLLEILLSKLIYLKNQPSTTDSNLDFQIVGMSATIPNLINVAKWLNAQLYVTHYRPVLLNEHIVIDHKIMSIKRPSIDQCEFNPIRIIDPKIYTIEAQTMSVLIQLSIETILDGHSCLVFCSTKSSCESLARSISKTIFEIGKKTNAAKTEQEKLAKERLSAILEFEKITSLIDLLRKSTGGCDRNLELATRFGCAYHHAGLTMDERSLIEQAFRDGILKILCCTSTLSAGVNLPARRVFITSAFDFSGKLMELMSYYQMIGRAGRKGIDTLGESFVLCSNKDEEIVKNFLSSSVRPICSRLIPLKLIENLENNKDEENAKYQPSFNDYLVRAVLEIIVNGLAKKKSDIFNFISCTFLSACLSADDLLRKNHKFFEQLIRSVLRLLEEKNFIYFNDDLETKFSEKSIRSTLENELSNKIEITPLARAVVTSGISPSDGCFIFTELNRCRESLCLVNDLHLLYETTPTFVASQLPPLDWKNYLELYYNMDENLKKVAQLIGIKESFIYSQISDIGPANNTDSLLVHRRFYASLALYEIINEIPFAVVQKKFGLNKGLLQSLQQQSSTFAGMLTNFCYKIGWSSLAILIEQFQPRLSMGVQHDLIDLVRIPCLNSIVARQLYSKGYDSVVSLIHSKTSEITQILLHAYYPLMKETFLTNSHNVGETKIYISSIEKYLNIKDFAKLIIDEARQIVEVEIGQKLNFTEVDSDENDQKSENSQQLQEYSSIIRTNQIREQQISGENLQDPINQNEGLKH